MVFISPDVYMEEVGPAKARLRTHHCRAALNLLLVLSSTRAAVAHLYTCFPIEQRHAFGSWRER